MTNIPLPKITAVTATKNRKELLRICIEAVASQNYSNMEHVVIDGGSNDGTPEMLDELSKKYPHLKWQSEIDEGISDAFNKGLKLATGDLISIIGDDDRYRPGAFEAIADAYTRDQEAGLYSGDIEYVRSDGTHVMFGKAAFAGHRELIECWKTWGRSVCIPAPSTFITKVAIQKVGGFDLNDKYAMDYRHWIHITEHFRFVRVDQLLADFRYDDGTVTKSLEDKQWAETLEISKQYWGKTNQLGYWKMAASFAHYELKGGSSAPLFSRTTAAIIIRKLKLRFYPIYSKLFKRGK